MEVGEAQSIQKQNDAPKISRRELFPQPSAAPAMAKTEHRRTASVIDQPRPFTQLIAQMDYAQLQGLEASLMASSRNPNMGDITTIGTHLGEVRVRLRDLQREGKTSTVTPSEPMGDSDRPGSKVSRRAVLAAGATIATLGAVAAVTRRERIPQLSSFVTRIKDRLFPPSLDELQRRVDREREAMKRKTLLGVDKEPIVSRSGYVVVPVRKNPDIIWRESDTEGHSYPLFWDPQPLKLPDPEHPELLKNIFYLGDPKVGTMTDIWVAQWDLMTNLREPVLIIKNSQGDETYRLLSQPASSQFEPFMFDIYKKGVDTSTLTARIDPVKSPAIGKYKLSFMDFDPRPLDSQRSSPPLPQPLSSYKGSPILPPR